MSWLQGHGFSCLCARSTAEAEALMSLQAPDVVVVDLAVGIEDPIAFLLQATADGRTQVILIGRQGAALVTISALQPGATAAWPDAPTPQVAAVRQALDRLMGLGQGRPLDGRSTLPVLTPRERDLVTCLATGMGNQEIANHLHISEKTVRNLLTRLYGKLGVSSRTQALILLQQHGMVSV